ncbi:MAG: UDP-N-acetylmuramate--L-alanine ligase [Fastidiosipilaceae bacterium]|jgi:UDP-N-acetylmuramate--alanine ligase
MEDKTLTSLSDIPTGSLLYFVGVGGISMCGLAQFAWHMGFQVAGSDRQASEHTELLSDMGIQVFIGHDSARVDALKPFALIHTAAVHRDNPEWRRAIELGIPVMERSVFLGLITRDFKRVINIAGTHGKTTTTAMCSTILLASGADPTIHLGAALKSLDSNTVRMGAPRELLVSEACEYSNSYHEFTSTTATILNIDIDHMDFFRDLDDLLDSFARFTDKIVEGGTLVLPHWGRYMPDLLSRIIKRRAAMSRDLVNVVTFGAHRAPLPQDHTCEIEADPHPGVADYLARPPIYNYRNLQYANGLPGFDFYKDDSFLAHIDLPIPGEHNVENAVAAMVCALGNGADVSACQTALSEFTGAEGRFTIKGTFNGALVVGDYAHHPSSTVATLKAARELPHNHIWIVYQPLTYARVKQFFDAYIDALLPCEHTIFYEIYSDREDDDLGMSSKLLCDVINEKGGSAEFAITYDDIVLALREITGPDDIILFLGPEQVRSFADKLVREEGGELSE